MPSFSSFKAIVSFQVLLILYSPLWQLRCGDFVFFNFVILNFAILDFVILDFAILNLAILSKDSPLWQVRCGNLTGLPQGAYTLHFTPHTLNLTAYDLIPYFSSSASLLSSLALSDTKVHGP